MSHLQVILRVPVRVKDNAGVRRREVDSQAAGSRAQKEHEAVRVGLAEAVDGRLPQVPTNPTVYPLVQVPASHKDCHIRVMYTGFIRQT